MSRKKWVYSVSVAAVLQAAMAASAQSQTVAVDPALLEQLQDLIQQQQDQIENLQTRLDQLEQTSAETQSIASEAQTTATEAIDTTQRLAAIDTDTVVTSGNDKVKLSLSGQINRAVNLADDGNSTRAYFVDNDTSNSRIRFVGTGQITEETTLGTTIEVGLSPNNSFEVSQDNQNVSSSEVIDLRKVEASFRNDRFGQIVFGKGQAAADDTAEYDLSLVAGPIMYSGISDIVGGLQFTRGGNLTGIKIGDAFFNFDGNRQNRARYDSPVIGPGLQVSVSAGADENYDAALTWGGDYGDWTGVDIGSVTTLGAISIRDPNESNVDYRLAGSFSALHNPTGIGATISAGGDKRKGSGDDPYNLYGKLTLDRSFFDLGPTGLGVDVTYGEHFSGQGDKSFGFGVAAVQLLESVGTEVYGQFRVFDLDRAAAGGGSVEKVYVGTIGTRAKF